MLKKFFKAKSNAPIEKDFHLSAGLSQTMLQFLGSRGIPTMPGAAQKAFSRTAPRGG